MKWTQKNKTGVRAAKLAGMGLAVCGSLFTTFNKVLDKEDNITKAGVISVGMVILGLALAVYTQSVEDKNKDTEEEKKQQESLETQARLLLEQAEQNAKQERLLSEIQRAMNPIDGLKMQVSFALPMDDDFKDMLPLMPKDPYDEYQFVFQEKEPFIRFNSLVNELNIRLSVGPAIGKFKHNNSDVYSVILHGKCHSVRFGAEVLAR